MKMKTEETCKVVAVENPDDYLGENICLLKLKIGDNKFVLMTDRRVALGSGTHNLNPPHRHGGLVYIAGGMEIEKDEKRNRCGVIRKTSLMLFGYFERTSNETSHFKLFMNNRNLWEVATRLICG